MPIRGPDVFHRGDPLLRLNDRFELKAQAGAGGMGTVYQAIDRRTDQLAAVKILAVKSVTDVGRFDQEATLLQELRHPGIVRYVDHGLTSHGDPYIAMEWLEGETLEQRLARGRLAQAGVAHLAGRVLDALAVAHEHDIVHRDIKPSNIFLVGWRLFDIRIIDFGVARRRDARRFTRRGLTVGTPNYAAPEQARGEGNIDGRADIFSLGCVLFECLTGAPPWKGSDAQKILTDICTSPVPSLREAAPTLDPELTRLVDKMLTKDRRRRPSDPRALAATFRRMGARLGAAEDAQAAAGQGRPPAALGFGEQRTLCGLLVSFAPESVAREPGHDPPDPGGPAAVVRAEAQRMGFAAEVFSPGAYVLAPLDPGTVGDQAREAVALAAVLNSALPGARLCAALGRATLLAGMPVGPLTDRLVAGLPEEPGTVGVSGALGRLLPASWIAHGPGETLLLVSQAALPGAAGAGPWGGDSATRPAPPFWGREREMDLLLHALGQAASERRSRAALVVGGPGLGKSRLARALVERVSGRDRGAVFFLAAERDESATPFALVNQLLVGNLGARDGEGGPAAGAEEAGGDPLATREGQARLQTAFIDWLDEISSAGPVLIACDDLQWADIQSLTLLATALDCHADRPIFLVGFARPEVDQIEPALWQSRPLERWRLPPLAVPVGQDLLRWHLAKVTPEIEDFALARWEGNPFFLAELARAAAAAAGAGKPALLAPDTVLGTVEARLLRVDEEPRRVLRAASLLGDTFEFEGVLSLLGLKGRQALETALGDLEAAEFIRKLGEATGVYAFRQKLVREASFATLTPEDRTLGVERARQWLEEAGKTLPDLLLGRRVGAVRRDGAAPGRG